MENEEILSEQEELEYKVTLLQAERDECALEVEALKLQKEQQERLYAAVSKRINQPVDENTINTIKLPRVVWGEVMDELYGNPNDLIRPSHQIKEYSLVRKQPELQEYVPVQNPSSPLELLNDKSTSRAFEVMNEYTSESTKRAYMGDLVYIHAWLSAAGFCFNKEISDKEIKSFIMQHVEGLEHEIDQRLVDQGYKSKVGPHKLATIKRRLISLSIFLERATWNNPMQNKEIKQLLSKLTKKYGESKPAGKAITRDILEDILDACTTKCGKDRKQKAINLIDLRDKALILFGWGTGGRRRSEIVDAEIKNLVGDSHGEFVYTIPRSKTDQEGKGHPVPVKGRVAKALRDWLKASGVVEGPIFRAVKKGGKVEGKLNDNAPYRIVLKRLKQAGYEEKEFCAHSLRSGFVTEAGRKNKPLGDVMAMTTHKNVGTVMKYYQAGNIVNNSAANLADE